MVGIVPALVMAVAFSRTSGLLLLSLLRRWCLGGERNNVLPSNDDQPQAALDLFLDILFFVLDYPVLISIREYNIHVLVISQKGANHHTAILNSNPDSKVNPL